MRKQLITFDQDWAPDWAVNLCIDLMESQRVPFTFFVTHRSPVLHRLRRAPGVELGIHPNFLDASTHGATPSEVLETVLDLVPEAKSMRTHSLMQSTPLLTAVCQSTSIRNDVSLLLPFSQELPITHFRFSGSRITRLPFSWEDDEAMARSEWDWDTRVWPGPRDGTYVYNFHPIHVALNSNSMSPYGVLKSRLGSRPLHALEFAEAKEFINPGRGARTYLEELLCDERSEWLLVDSFCSIPRPSTHRVGGLGEK